MRQSRTRVEDERLERERQLKYRGTARISLDVLQFVVDDDRPLDVKNVQRLVKIYQREGCRRQFVSNHILVVIDQACLDSALDLSRISAAALLTRNTNDPAAVGDYPQLQVPVGVRLTCLHGRHRIQAAREFLSPRDKWWIADLYLAGKCTTSQGGTLTSIWTDSSSDVQRSLIEEYANETIPPDGEIYRKIRHYHFQRNYSFECRWWARLRGCRARNLKSLLSHPEIAAGFDALLDVPGLWSGMQLTTLHKMLALRTDDTPPPEIDPWQEILNYLEHIRKFWYDLLEDPSALSQIDDQTVRFVELRAPRASTRDAEEIQSKLQVGQIFGAFSEDDRRHIFGRLCRFPGLVPSLNTFFRDLIYWVACIGSVKHLITVSRRDTVFSAFERQFTGVNQQEDQIVIQEDELNFTTIPGSFREQTESGYRQIIAFAMRNFLEIPQESVNRDVTVRPRVRANHAVLRRFAHLALRLGFESPLIHQTMAFEERAVPPAARDSSVPVLVTSGPGEKLQRRRIANFYS
nr:hypothetical protein LTR18_002318 [Exophiala xenobiotica]